MVDKLKQSKDQGKKLTNITDIIELNAKKFPNNIAIEYSEKKISYYQLNKLIWQIAGYFYNKRIKEKDVIALYFEDELLLFISLLSLARLGATSYILPQIINENLNTEVLDQIDLKFVITDTNKKALQTNLELILFNQKLLEDLPEEIDFNIKSKDSKTPYIYVTGSGSTGRSKIIPINHIQELKKVELSLDWLPKGTNHRVASMSTIYYYSTIIMYLRALNAAMIIVIFNRKTPIEKICIDYKINILFSSLFHVHNMLKFTKNKEFSSLNMLLITGSLVSSNLIDKILKRLTKNLYIAYGTNETSTATLIRPNNIENLRTSSVGWAIKGVEVEIVDKSGNLLPKNQVGLIKIKSPATSMSYLKNHNDAKAVFKEDGFYPNDLGKLTEDNQLIYLGRSDTMMIMNGINIYPAEIENTLMSLETVADAIAFPLKSDISQDVPACAVMIEEKFLADEKQLISEAYKKLGNRSPRAIIILDKIPRNTQGKLIRKDLNSFLKKNETKIKIFNLKEFTPKYH